MVRGGWYAREYGADGEGPRGVAFFSMEFGLDEALPLYAGGLGVLAGDYLKAASDLGVPVVGLGLLYQEGYFRQTIDAAGRQHELYPYNDPTTLPISPVLTADGQRLHVDLEFPGRVLHVRVWRAAVGSVPLYLLDTNDPTNRPADRGITAKLYGGDSEVQFFQEAVLGIGGWRLIDALGLDVDVCHLNEGHAALAVLERARCFKNAVSRDGAMPCTFHDALWATRAGNVFTTHTAVAAAFDRFARDFVEQHLPFVRIYAERLGVSLPALLALGRRDPNDANEPFNLAYLAMRGSTSVNGVSALHGAVSRRLFQNVYPRWPEREVPITHVTNGVHTPTWSSTAAEQLWEARCGADPWRGDLANVAYGIAAVTDDELWACRTKARQHLVGAIRRRLSRQLSSRGADPAVVAGAADVFDPDVLTLGFARRFTAYKRPTLLLQDRARLVRLLENRDRPVQLVVAGKAHPADDEGKHAIEEWIAMARDVRLRDRIVFLEDYDVTLARELVRGVDVWINTPRRPWEACGTSGMKVLANGGLNVSVRDGWWDEAYSPAVGWAIGDGATHDASAGDAVEADHLYRLLEDEIVPEFYTRDARRLPVRWLERVRASMSELAPRFSANRMVREYVDTVYAPAAQRFRRRARDGAHIARELVMWADAIGGAWSAARFGALEVRAERDGYRFSVGVDLGTLDPCMVRVELYADPDGAQPAVCLPMQRLLFDIDAGRTAYEVFVATRRPASHFTPRLVPFHPEAVIPLEAAQIVWER